MSQSFTATDKTISGSDLINLVSMGLSVDCYTNRPSYQLVNREELWAFLAKTKVDRYKWCDQGRDVVCAEIALLLWGVVVQEGIRCKLAHPLSFGRLSFDNVDEGKTGHVLDVAVFEDSSIGIIEDQNDRIMAVGEFLKENPKLVPWKCDFV